MRRAVGAGEAGKWFNEVSEEAQTEGVRSSCYVVEVVC
jgi:hypothetical protein